MTGAAGTTRKAHRDPTLNARVTGRIPLVYREGPSSSEDRPPFVRAASGLSNYREYLIAIQDDANWLALIDGEEVRSLPLPRGADGARLFDKSHGNEHDKVDLEACVVMPRGQGFELVAFGSGTGQSSEWILHARCTDPKAGEAEADSPAFEARFCGASDFYESLRHQRDFSGGRVNIEGAVGLDGGRILLLQRGNCPPDKGDPVDATAIVAWSELEAYLDEKSPPPPLHEVQRYDLGSLDGVRLTFSDAEDLGDGRILYSASAEDVDSGRIAGSVLGVLEADGSGRWCEIVGEDGQPFTGKIEGLTVHPSDRGAVRFVIDDDDDGVPSDLFLAELGGSFLARGAG